MCPSQICQLFHPLYALYALAYEPGREGGGERGGEGGRSSRSRKNIRAKCL